LKGTGKPARTGQICFLAAWLTICGTAAAVGGTANTTFEPDYVTKTEAIADGDSAARLALAGWCRERGFLREMLNEIAIVLEENQQNSEARALLGQKADGDLWIPDRHPLAFLSTPEPDFGRNTSRRTKLIESGKKRVFSEGKKSFRFRFWTDLAGARSQEYSKLLNIHYDRLKGYFQISKTELGINVVIFSKRSDYLNFYNRTAGKSGENTGGFFTYGDSYSLLCFYDNPYDSDRVFTTARHECTHLLVKHCLRGASLATWFEEGVACYFASDASDRTGKYAADCLVTVQLDRMRGATLPLVDLMATPREKIQFRHYAAAWSWITYLRSRPETKSKFGRLLKQLRQRAQKREDGWEEATNHFFHQLFGHPEKLQAGWEEFAKKELHPLDGEQYLHCASIAFNMAGVRSSSRTGLKREEKRWLLRRGEEWLSQAESAPGNGLKARCSLKRIAATLSRAHCNVYDEREMTGVAVEMVRALDSFLKTEENNPLAYEAGSLAYAALCAVWNVGKYDENEETIACDFDALIEEREGALEKTVGDGKALELTKIAARNELEMVRLQRGASADLARLARRAFALALDRTPDHSPAARKWLLLGLGFAPDNLEGAFRHVLFQIQLDPDDISLAALAAAYSAMGKREYAGTLLERARSISPNENALSSYARYVE
jgi:hypothetical protein